MRIDASSLAAALHGELVGPDVVLDGLSIDSRSVADGQLFAAVQGERDGHDFAAAALAGGAGAVLVERVVEPGPSIVVESVATALPALAGFVRDRMPDRVIGVTGSVGKTTTKDLLASVLGQHFVTAASERSFNNELGVPLTLANAPDDVEAVVVEMGARGAGHITTLCDMARPTVGVVTTVEGVHTEVMGDLEQIARTKGELIEALPSDGLAVLNAEVALVAAMAARSAAPVLRFGEGGDVRASGVEVDVELRPSFRLESPWGSGSIHLGIRGVHNVANALAAAAAALGLGVPLERVVAGLESSGSSPWRMDLQRASSGLLVLNDAYNAGPASMAAALRSLVTLPVTRRVAVVGVMAELGDTAPSEHARIAELAESLDVRLVPVATELYGVAPVPDTDEALATLGGLDLGDGDAVLVKGSRVAGLEVVAEALLV